LNRCGMWSNLFRLGGSPHRRCVAQNHIEVDARERAGWGREQVQSKLAQGTIWPAG